MTERTFREPSPNRNTSSGYRYEDPPPVPALPRGYTSPPPVPTKSNRRAASVEPPERVLSPPPTLPNGRGVSLDRGPGLMPSQLKARTQAKSPQKGPAGGAGHGQSRDSVNYSRPMSPANSPPTSPLNDRRAGPLNSQIPKQQASSNIANVGRLRDGEAENIQYALQETAQAPVKKKKKKVPKNTEGSFLANGGSGGRAVGTAVRADDIRQQPLTDSAVLLTDSESKAVSLKTPPQPLPKKTEKKAATYMDSRLGESAYGSYASDSDSMVSEQSNVTDRPRTFNTRAAGLLAKQPSIVREDREAEEQEEYYDSTTKTNTPAQNGNVQKSTGTRQSKAMLNGKEDAHSLGQTSHVHTHTKAASLDIPNTKDNFMPEKVLNTQPIRQQSLSPARAAHFSAQPVLETPDSLKHQPPARSISPVKSALKHSPSRGPSPVASVSTVGTRRRGPASEASDTTSMISDDGPKSVSKKKKSARVSFDSESVVVGRAATPPTDQDSPMIMSPQNRDASTMKWLGLGSDRGHTAPSNKDQDTSIQPTPALPLFGSVRGRAQKDQPPDSAQEPPETASTTTDLGTSSDQRIGGILSRVFGSEEVDHVSQKPVLSSFGDEPLPPEVTTVEGTGYHSDTDTSTYSDKVEEPEIPGSAIPEATNENDVRSDQPPAQYEPAATAEQSSSHEVNSTAPSIAVQPATPALGDTPSIAIQPATPGLDELSKSKDQYWFDMPGGFPISTDDSTNEEPTNTVGIEHRPPELTPATIGMAEPEPEAVAAQHRPGTPIVGAVAEGLRIQIDPDTHEESDDTNNSIYSDAAEDLSDLEGDGFGSINAIVESPASPHLGLLNGRQSESPTKTTKNTTNPRPSPLSRNESELSEPGSEAGWDQAQAYWSGLSQSRKQQIERAAAQGDLTESSNVLKPKTKKRKIVPKKPVEDDSLPSLDQKSQAPGRPASPKTPLRARNPALKSSMRDMASEGPQGIQMRSSMRDPAPAKSSARASLPPEPTTETRGALRKKNRPSSAVASSDYSKPLANSANGHDRSASLGTPQYNTSSTIARTHKTNAPLSKPIGRTVSNGSDSSSSFKKARPRTSDSGRYTMKRSMRGSSVDDRPTSMHGRASSMTARTSSPVDTTRRPFSSVGPSMRTSMRDSIEPRKSNRGKSPSRFPGFGKSSKPKAAAAKGSANRFSSRFADSSDEDDGPIIRRSRYADSSDEDEPAGLTPVRGIPRRIDEGDSTDLEDSSADEKAAPKSNKTMPQQTSKLEGAALGAGSLRAIPEAGDSPAASMGTGLQAKRAAEKEKKKRNFFGGLGSKKTTKSEPLTLPPSDEVPRQDTISTQQGPTLDTSTSNAPESPQSTKQQRLLGPGSPVGDSQTSATAQKSPKSPKLQRRISAQQAEKIQMKRGLSDSWPLPQSPGGTSTPSGRPTTSDGTPKIKNGMIGASGLSNEVSLSRPGMGDRTNTVETTATGGTGAVKKKKGWFKKAFRR